MFEERGLEQQMRSGRSMPLSPPSSAASGALVIERAGIGGPAGRHRVAQVERASVVGEIEHVMVAAPADLQRLALLARAPASQRAAKASSPLSRASGDEAVEHVEEEEAHPDAGADLAPAERVDAVVPVAGAQQRQAVLAEMLERVVDREAGMLVDRRRSRATARGMTIQVSSFAGTARPSR